MADEPTPSEQPAGIAAVESAAPLGADEDRDRGRLLFKYVTVDEWRDYRAIIGVFADTFFAEFTPAEVASRLDAAGYDLEERTVADRLEALRRWGNLTVSTSVGNPTSVADYYRRRNRYLITTSGQNVHQVVEGVLASVDDVRDVTTGRLRTLRDALVRLSEMDLRTADAESLADAVGVVFDNHAAFTDEIAQFFAAINQWQARYDLDADEFRFFAEVLVSYVGDRLDEIERTARPIGVMLEQLRPSVPRIVERIAAADDLATRVERAGLERSVQVARHRGAVVEDWDHLIEWFRPRRGAASRIDRLGRDAVAAIRTLTANLTRLSRIGVSASSRRADFLRLARWFDDAPDAARCHELAACAFGLHPARHWGVSAEDAHDPVSSTTSWWDAPRAPVAVSLRERGDATNRGRASPMPDQRAQKELLRRRREAEKVQRSRVDHELASIGRLDGATLSRPAMERLQELLGGVRHLKGDDSRWRRNVDGDLELAVRRSEAPTVVHVAEGTLTLQQLEVVVSLTAESQSGGDDER